MAIVRGAPSIGFSNSTIPPATLPNLPYFSPDSQEILRQLMEKVDGLQTLVQGKADANKIKTLIQYSDEAVRIQAEDIVLIGDVTIGKIIKDQNGTGDGTIPISITRIIGDRIRTGSIVSNNWSASQGAALDLDNGIVVFGGTSNPSLYFENGDLTVSGTLTAGSLIAGSVVISNTGYTMDTLASAASFGPVVWDNLYTSTSSILRGTLRPTNTGAIATGSISWNNTTGQLTSGTGIAITEWGIIGANAGVPTFTIEALTGNATFAGDILTSGRVICQGAWSFEGQDAAIHGTVPGSGTGVRGKGSVGVDGVGTYGVRGTGNSAGVYGITSGSLTADGVRGQASGSNQVAIYAWHLGGGTALEVAGKSILGGEATFWGRMVLNGTEIVMGTTAFISKTRVNGHRINVYDPTTHAFVASYEYEFFKI